MNGIHVTGSFVPTSEQDTFPVTTEKYHKGGYRSVSDSAERYAITKERRTEGMIVKEISSGIFYTLKGGIEDSCWQVETFGGSTSGGGATVLNFETLHEMIISLNHDDNTLATCSEDIGTLYVFSKIDGLWLSQKSKVIKVDGAGDKFLNDTGSYVILSDVVPDFEMEDPNNRAFIKNKPDVYSKEEVVAAFELFLSSISANYSTKSELASIATHTHGNFNLLNLLKTDDAGGLSFNGKTLLSGIKLTSKSLEATLSSTDLVVSLDVPTLLLNHVIETHMDSEVIISGDNILVEMWDGSIMMETFTNTGVQIYKTGFTKDLVIKTNGVGKIKFNYIYIERS